MLKLKMFRKFIFLLMSLWFRKLRVRLCQMNINYMWSEKIIVNKLREVYWLKRDWMSGEWRKLHNDELHVLYYFPNVVRTMKSGWLRLSDHATRLERKRKLQVYSLMVGRLEGKRPLGKSKRRWDNNMSRDLREVRDVNWLDLEKNKIEWRTFVTGRWTSEFRKPWSYLVNIKFKRIRTLATEPKVWRNQLNIICHTYLLLCYIMLPCFDVKWLNSVQLNYVNGIQHSCPPVLRTQDIASLSKS